MIGVSIRLIFLGIRVIGVSIRLIFLGSQQNNWGQGNWGQGNWDPITLTPISTSSRKLWQPG